MRQVVLQDHDAALREAGAKLQMEIGFGNRPHHGHGVHLFGPYPGERQARGDGVFRQFAATAGVGAAREFGFLDGGHQLAVFEDGARGIAQDSTDPEDDHLPRFSIFAQASFSPTVRLKTSLAALESESTAK